MRRDTERRRNHAEQIRRARQAGRQRAVDKILAQVNWAYDNRPTHFEVRKMLEEAYDRGIAAGMRRQGIINRRYR